MSMASRIAVMSEGRVLQVGTPQEIYEHPNCRFVADFIGNVNLFDGVLSLDQIDRCEITTPEGLVHVGHGITGALGMALSVAVRPEKIHISKISPEVPHNLFAGTVREIAYFGSYSTFIVAMPSGKMIKITAGNTARHESSQITWNDDVFFWWDVSAPVTLTR